MADLPSAKSNDIVAKSTAQLRAFWDRLPTRARFLMLLIIVVAVGTAVALSMYEQTDEQVLFSNLTTEDASAIIEHLKSKKVAYRLDGAGTTILVPGTQVHEIRLELASQNLPAGGGVGFELFDQNRFGMTEFEERVSMKRALEGELSRTIGRLEPIRSARVHLVLPKQTLFGKKQEEAEASITVELHKSRELGEGTVQSIVHLVASSVEGLNPDNVTVIDTRGRLLSQETGGSFGAPEMEYQKKFEKNLELHLLGMLDQTLGPDRSVVRVTANFDFAKRESTEEHYDPDRSVLRSEQREVETSGSRADGAIGTPGARSNLPGGPTAGTTGTGENRKRESETRNYEVDKVVNHTLGPAADLKRLSVAVLVDGKNKPGEAFQARPVEELKKLELAVRSSIGFDAKRGDTLEVQSVPFNIPSDIGTGTADDIGRPPWWKQWLPIAVGALAALAVFVFLIGFRRRRPRAESVSLESLPFPSRVQELETMIDRSGALPGAAAPQLPARSRRDNGNAAALMEEVRHHFMDESEGASRVLKTWLAEARKQPEPQKEVV